MSNNQQEAMERHYDLHLEPQRQVDHQIEAWQEHVRQQSQSQQQQQHPQAQVQVKREQPVNAKDIPSFVNKIKARFPANPVIWQEFSKIMQTNKPARELLPLVTHIFGAAAELVDDFKLLMDAFDQARNIPNSTITMPSLNPLPTPLSIPRNHNTTHQNSLAIRSSDQSSPIQLPRFRMPSSGASDDDHDSADAEDDDAPRDRKVDVMGNYKVDYVSPHLGAYLGHGDERAYEQLQKSQDAERRHIKNLLVLPAIDIPREERRKTPVAMSCTLMEHQKVCLTWLIEQEESRHKRGGLLADAMGLGKTIQALSLILARPSINPARKATLILAPLALLKQWEQEIKTKVKPRYQLKTLILHGAANRSMTVARMLTYDVVMTTYGTLVSEYKCLSQRKSKKLLLLAKDTVFHRIILDEAHNIKNRNAKASVAVTYLRATYRLCMTGTPFMNRTAEIFPIIRFLRISPFNNWEKFSEDIERPLNRQGNEASRAIQKLQALFRSFTLRRSKTSKLDGKLILQLPKKTIHLAETKFDEDQMAFYEALEKQQQLKLNKYIKLGTVGKNYTYILVLLLRLRQACDHPHLIKDHGIPDGTQLTAEQMCQLALEFDEDVVARIQGQQNFQCLVCEEVTENPVLIHPCGHHLCGGCFTAMMELRNPNFRGGDSEYEDGARQSPCPVSSCTSDIDPERVVCHNFFVEAHTQDGFGEENSEDDDSDGSDASGYSEEVEDDEEDELGNLKGFIVSDGQESEADDDAADEKDDDLHDRDIKDEEVDESSKAVEEVWAEVPKQEGSSEGECADESDSDSLPSLEGVWKQASKGKMKGEPVLKSEWDLELYTSASTSKGKRKRTKSEDASESKKKAKTRSRDIDKKKKTKVLAADKKTSSQSARKKGKKKAFISLADLKKAGSRSAAAKAKYLQRLKLEYVPSAKIDKTMELLHAIREKEPREKILVFSLWTSFLDLLEIPIDDAGFKYVRYDGSMNPSDRDSAIKSFMENPQVDIMLVSLMAGNAGLNLTAASQVIVLEPFWNPYVEDQAVDRAHRIGQKKDVTVHRVLISGTVEDRIVELQESKRRLVDAALSEEGAQGVSRLSLRQLKGLFGF